MAYLDMAWLEARDKREAGKAAAVDAVKTGLASCLIVLLVLEQWWVIGVDMLANAIASYVGVRRLRDEVSDLQ